NKADLTQNLQVLTGICDGKSSLSRQALHRALAIGKDVDDLEPPAVRQRLRQSGELVKQRCLGCPSIPLGRAVRRLRRHFRFPRSIPLDMARGPWGWAYLQGVN